MYAIRSYYAKLNNCAAEKPRSAMAAWNASMFSYNFV